MKKIFLSSTATDLADYRQALHDAIGCLDGYHCILMENFGARNSSAEEFDAKRIEECSLFIGIIGFFHGSTPKDNEKSFTELEYDAAVALGKPCLMFMGSNDGFLRPGIIESPEKQSRQEGFRGRVASDRIVADFVSPQDLKGKVITAIFNWEFEQSQSQPLSHPVNLEWLSIPRPPEPYFAHSYPLQEHFTGRLREREMLSSWLNEDSHALLVLLGIGGMGKSALVWYWLHRDILNRPFRGEDRSDEDRSVTFPVSNEQQPDGILWWSFYDTDATFLSFLDNAIAYISENKIPPERIPSVNAKARTLVSLLQQRQILLVLDGFERLLRAYAGLSGAYQDDGNEQNFVADPCACVDIQVVRFLSLIASSPLKSRILITSRLFPKELGGFGGNPLPVCRREEVSSLDPEDAVNFFRSVGVQGTRAEINSACATYGYHALTLRLLAGYIINHFSRPGEISLALGFNPLRNLVARKHNILDLAYEALPPNDQQLLSRLAAFRSPVDYSAVKALSSYEIEEDLEQALQHLVSRGLVFVERSSIRFDLHPIVRRYAYERLADKKQIHSQLRDYFFGISATDNSQQGVPDTLSPTVELYHHTVRAGLYAEAYKLFTTRLSPVLSRIGAYNTKLELLQALLRDGADFELLIEDPKDQLELLNLLGIAYGYTGQTRLAVNLFNREIELASKIGQKEDEVNAIGNAGYFLMRLGDLATAEEFQRRAIVNATEDSDNSNLAYSRMRLGLILSYSGKFSEAVAEFKISRSIFLSFRDLVGECHLWSYRVLRAHLIKDYSLALICANKALNLAQSISDGRILTRAKNLMALALLGSTQKANSKQTANYSDSETLLSEALARCRQSGLLELEASILLNLARWHQSKNETQYAKKAAEEALTIATRCEYGLEQAEIHNFLSTIE